MQFMEYIISLAMLAYTRLGYERSTPNLLTSYDFIVVGGGTAGSIVASKLSEDPKVNVLLLESGGAASEYTDIPYTYLYYFPELAQDALHCFGTEKPASGACWNATDNTCQICESRILGGGSTINGFTYLRAPRVDYDGWASQGLKGWSYNELLPSMMALESFDRFSTGRGNNGPVHVTEGNGDFYNLNQTWLDAGRELGFNILADVNEPSQVGFGLTQNNLYNGARQTMENVFLREQQRQRPNLHIKMFATVTKILFNNVKNSQEASGVEYVMNGNYGNKMTVRATREVILSTGAIKTPQILIHSGVGPADQVAYVGEKLVSKLEGVGFNLQDHAKLHMIQFKADKLTPKFQPPQCEDYFTWAINRTGPMATGSSSGLAFLHINNTGAWDDSQIEIALSGEMKASVILNAPKSRGRVMIRQPENGSFDGLDPYVKLNLLEHPDDVTYLVEGAKFLKNIFQTKAFGKLGAKSDYTHPHCDKLELFSDAYMKCLVKDATVSGFHYAGTAKMGIQTAKDKTAVVNERLQVYGVKKLRVADASIMPTVVRANPNAAVMLIGWKAAEMIKQDNGLKN